MLTSKDIRRVQQSGDDWDWAERVKADIVRIRSKRQRFHLTLDEIEPILRYKLRKQYGRTAPQRVQLTNTLVAAITGAAFQIDLPDRIEALKARAGILSSLPGVGIPVASAILAMSEPEEYGIIDVFAWRLVFGIPKASLTLNDYAEYMKRIWKWGDTLGWHAQRVEWCVWQLSLPSDAA